LFAAGSVASVPFTDKAGKRMPYPLRYAMLLASVVMIDFSVVMLWLPE
jgi:hypothetical protein